MGTGLRRLGRRDLPTVPVTLQTAGVDGAGGAGFPAYAKWERLEEVRWLLMNHQESEPNYFIDKYLGRERAMEFAEFFQTMLDQGVFEAVVVCAKEKDRAWLDTLEAATDATVVGPSDLPLPERDRRGVVIALTDDRYEYGMESVLLRLVGDVTMGTNLPMDFGWLVQNTESLANVIRALDDGTPVTEKYVHVDGDVPRHRFLLAPVGTPATTLLAEAGLDSTHLDASKMLADGGPGWCFAIEDDPDVWGLRKRTNCLLVLDRELAEANTLGDERINVLNPYLDAGEREYEQEPTRISPARVCVPLVSNPSLAGIVTPAAPVVTAGEVVEAGQLVARPTDEGFSTAVHASIDGVVRAVTDRYIEISRVDDDETQATDAESTRDRTSPDPESPTNRTEASEATDETESTMDTTTPRDETRKLNSHRPGSRPDDNRGRLHHLDAVSEESRFLPAVYWTWCADCGSYVTYPDLQDAADPVAYVCADCERAVRIARESDPASAAGADTSPA
jgi:electron transport complex protein RnfC